MDGLFIAPPHPSPSLDCPSNWDMRESPSTPPPDPITIRYEDGSGIECLAKQLLLKYPLLQNSQQMSVFVDPQSPSLMAIARFFTEISPNIALNHPPRSHHSQTEETLKHLKQHGMVNPFDSGFEFPKHIHIDIQADLGIPPPRMAQLEALMLNSDFCAHLYTRNELVCVLFLLFSKLLNDPLLPPHLHKSKDSLLYFLIVCRSMYKPHLPFHSLWHCVDVTQFTVYLLLSSQTPWYHLSSEKKLSLALAALGHDMLHPGIMLPVLDALDPEFKKRYGSLELFHSRIFQSILQQLWPEMCDYWKDCISQSIEATDLARHRLYLTCEQLDENIKFVHVLKMSDLASAARFADEQYDLTASLIFSELKDQNKVCKEKECLLHSWTLNEVQVSFLSKLVIPYFEWIVERVPSLKQFLECAKQHQQRYLAKSKS